MAERRMAAEISGDGGMTVAQRLRYVAFNLARNLGRRAAVPPRRSYCTGRLPRTPATASPGRVLTEAFLGRELPRLLPSRDIRVLEIGCGSGSLTRLLAEFGYRGSYVGVDVTDRFDRSAQSGFRREFVRSDAHRFEPEGQFDLIVSVSALEHIPDDRDLIQRLSGFVAPGGLQLHFLPSAWGLPVYLWHGYRQYSQAALGERFDAGRATVYSLGGVASFLLHFTFITLGEMMAPLRLRQRLPRLYGSLLDGSLRLDRWLPACATMVAVCQPAGRAWEGSHG
jgi:SAM-dependent methyltransferase